MAVELVTGHLGSPHVTAEQISEFNKGFLGDRDYIMNTRGKCVATVLNQNSVQIATGDVYASGRQIAIGTPEKVTIANGTQNKKRVDVIGIRYKKTPAGVETVKIEVIAGIPSNSYVTPTLPTEHITTNTNDAFIPLYRVYVNGIAGISTMGYMSVQESLEKRILDKVYPVGSVYISFSSTNPRSFLGGHWERLQDVFLFATAGTPGQTGGEKEHILTINEMPSHAHGIDSLNESYGSYPARWVPTIGNGKVLNDVSLCGFVGGNKPHNNMPPYITCYMWKRIAL